MRDFCTLDFHGRSFAVAFECLREVIEPPPLTPVPLAPSGVCGVVNLRGNLLPVLALDPLLGLSTPESVLARRPWMAVLQSGRHTFGILAAGIGTVRDVGVEPISGEHPPNPFIEGMLAVPDPKTPVIDLPALMRQLSENLRLATSFSNS